MADDSLTTIARELEPVLAGVDRDELEGTVRALEEAPRVFVTGEGRSGLMGRAFAMRLMHLGLTAYVVGETTTPALRDGDLLVAVSGSGTTAHTVQVAQAAVTAGARVHAVTSGAESALARLAATRLVLPAATKHRRPGEAPSRQPLSSLFDQATHLTLDAACLTLAERRQVDNDAARAAHANTE
ncbi:6-phospho-3-hexuloisomerase [Sinomonas atrocyanea]|uniref:6-phospho-3-hexuloisomerase n=1 Tax=Sinomonas atrocyanea TaxID=37927 RepID=UPI003D980563